MWFLRNGSSEQVDGTASGTTGSGPITLEAYGATGDDPFVQSTQVVGSDRGLERSELGDDGVPV